MIAFSYINYSGQLSHSDWISVTGIVMGVVLSIILYKLQLRLSDRQKVENRLQVEREIGKKLYQIHYNNSNSKIQIYNTRLINGSRFQNNKRSFFWGYPFHGAELFSANFDGLEFVVGIEKWADKKYYRVGVIDYERVLGVRPEGDGSFNGIIFYVKPRLLQLNKYAIAYKKFRYYSVDQTNLGSIKKPFTYRIRDALKALALKIKYYFWVKWKNLSRQQ